LCRINLHTIDGSDRVRKTGGIRKFGRLIIPIEMEEQNRFRVSHQ
jgi:hypothetical protein